MSEVSISLSGRRESFSRRRLPAASRLTEKLFITIFVIAFALLPNCFSSGNDPDDFVALLVANRVGNQKQHDASGQTQRLPSYFPAFQPILFNQSVRIGKN